MVTDGCGERGRELLRQRGELLERSFAHAYETGGIRRLHLGRENFLKRILIHLGGFNLSLVMARCSAKVLLGAGRAALRTSFWSFATGSRSLSAPARKRLATLVIFRIYLLLEPIIFNDQVSRRWLAGETISRSENAGISNPNPSFSLLDTGFTPILSTRRRVGKTSTWI